MFLWVNEASSLIFEGSLNQLDRIVGGTCDSSLLFFFLAGDSPSILCWIEFGIGTFCDLWYTVASLARGLFQSKAHSKPRLSNAWIREGVMSDFFPSRCNL
jgi:hypothetical protein